MTLDTYIQQSILPRYDCFDPAHQRAHALSVIRRSLDLASHYPTVRTDMALAAAAFHDLGLCEGRELHHLASGRMVRSDSCLPQWFTPEEIETIAQAAEDHRASSGQTPRSLLGMIVAEADRQIDEDIILRRCIQYGISHFPQLSEEEHYLRVKAHLTEKYGEGGYLHLLLPESPNARPLEALRALLHDEAELHKRFVPIFREENAV